MSHRVMRDGLMGLTEGDPIKRDIPIGDAEGGIG